MFEAYLANFVKMRRAGRNEVSSIDILNAIKSRRSIHQFKKDHVDKNILTDIFKYASWAPTHYMKESWRLRIYQSEGKLHFVDAILASYERIGMIKRDGSSKTEKMIASMRDFLLSIPHHALIYFPKEDDPVRYEEEYASICAFIQNAQLAAWEYGVGMLWTITPYMHDPEFYRDIGIATNMKIAAVLQIGYPEKIPRSKGRTPIDQKLEFIEKLDARMFRASNSILFGFLFDELHDFFSRLHAKKRLFV